MKVITSYGGPFVGLDGKSVTAWSGIDGKRFVGDASPHPNDYEAGGNLTNGRMYAPCNIAKIDGETYSAFLISVGFDLFLMRADDTAVYLFQAEYADHDWTESSVTDKDFERASFDSRESISLNFDTGKMYIFDSAMDGGRINENRFEFNILPGKYILHTAIYKPDESTLLFLHKLIRDV